MLYRSISICGAVTANELNTSILAKFCSDVSRKLSLARQSTSGHWRLHSWTPQLTCSLSRSGNLKAGNVAENNFSIRSSSWGFDQPSSNGRYLTCNDGITCVLTNFKQKKKMITKRNTNYLINFNFHLQSNEFAFRLFFFMWMVLMDRWMDGWVHLLGRRSHSAAYVQKKVGLLIHDGYLLEFVGN